MFTGPDHEAPPLLVRHSCSGSGPSGHGHPAGALDALERADPVELSVKPAQTQNPVVTGLGTGCQVVPPSVVMLSCPCPTGARTASDALAGATRAELGRGEPVDRLCHCAPPSVERHSPAKVPVGQSAHSTSADAACRAPPSCDKQGLV